MALIVRLHLMIFSEHQMPKSGPRPHTCGPRPGAWKTGPDPELHRKYRAFIQQKNQAQFRGEDWQLSFEDWLSIWGTDFDRRGRGSQDLCLTRWDLEDSWTVSNCFLMERGEHMKRCGKRSHSD